VMQAAAELSFAGTARSYTLEYFLLILNLACSVGQELLPGLTRGMRGMRMDGIKTRIMCLVSMSTECSGEPLRGIEIGIGIGIATGIGSTGGDDDSLVFSAESLAALFDNILALIRKNRYIRNRKPQRGILLRRRLGLRYSIREMCFKRLTDSF
jgi:hypothetical protein